MDPIKALLETLRSALPGLDNNALAGVESQVHQLFAKFELVPKADYQAHMDILQTLKTQVTDLEARLAALED